MSQELIKKIRTDAGDLQIDYNALANLPTISNPNLLINSDFRNPINQRGKTTYTSAANNLERIFTVDRWNIQNGGTLTINDGSVTFTSDNATTGSCMFCQVVETLPTDDYTLQVKVKGGVNGAAIKVLDKSSQEVFNSQLTIGLNTFTMQNINIRSISINLGDNAYIELEWIKLECGTVATKFTPKLRAEELLSCYRFFYAVECRLLMNQYSSDHADGNIYYPIKMRTTPSVSLLEGTYFCSSKSTFLQPDSIEVNPNSFNEFYATIKIGKNNTDTFTPGNSINAKIKICLDAEIR